MKDDLNGYENLSKKQLIQRIEEMAEVIRQMEKYRTETELLTLPWIGNLGQWNWMIQNDKLLFNEKKLQT